MTTDWYPFHKYDNKQWVMPNCTVITTPPLEISGAGRRVRIAGKKSSFSRRNVSTGIGEALGAWCMESETTNSSITRFDLYDSPYQAFLIAGVTYRPAELPLEIRRTVNAKRKNSYEWQCIDSMRLPNTFVKQDDGELVPIKTKTSGEVESFDTKRALVKGLHACLTKWLEPIVAVTPHGKEVSFTITDDGAKHIETLLKELSEYYERTTDLAHITKTYEEFRLALSAAGLVLEPMNSDDIARLIAGKTVISVSGITTNEIVKHLRLDPVRGRVLLDFEPTVTETALAEWTIAQELARHQGRTDDLDMFLREYAKHAVARNTK